ncbi:hypothetical protein EJ110_NYTH45258 [Nymphaea thermarum]|nr:hypothetical protein EJ110_NYTH45258 [Nymphaea thermarum]
MAGRGGEAGESIHSWEEEEINRLGHEREIAPAGIVWQREVGRGYGAALPAVTSHGTEIRGRGWIPPLSLPT